MEGKTQELQLSLEDIDAELNRMLQAGLIVKEKDENGREVYNITQDGLNATREAERIGREECEEYP
jgi:DNA-binding transcriptional regulator PaaX